MNRQSDVDILARYLMKVKNSFVWRKVLLEKFKHAENLNKLQMHTFSHKPRPETYPLGKNRRVRLLCP